MNYIETTPTPLRARFVTGVLVTAVHPALGNLYWEKIPGAGVGGSDGFSITNCIDRALLLEANWRSTDRGMHGNHLTHFVRSHVKRSRVLEFDGWYDEVEFSETLMELFEDSRQSEETFLNFLLMADWVDVPAPNTIERLVDRGGALEWVVHTYPKDNGITPWEAGRLAANQVGSSNIENPHTPDTRDHDEWNRGYAHGVGESKVSNGVAELAVEIPYPVMSVEHLPERSFWAVANQLQLSHGFEEKQLAARIGVSSDLLRSEMIRHHFWDEDAIPLGIREAS